MRNFLIGFYLIYLGCNKMEMPSTHVKPICDHIEYHGTYLFNNECRSPELNVFRSASNRFYIQLIKTGPISEDLTFTISKKSNLEDTLFLETLPGFIPSLEKADVLYSYIEGGIVGSWEIPNGSGTKQDFLIIDYFNEDTTIIEGRFQCKFQTRDVNSFVNAPDTLNISCGSFKLKKQ